MKRKPTFGHAEVVFPVWPICKKANLRYIELDDELEKPKEFSDPHQFVSDWKLVGERMEAATITIVFAASFLDQFIYKYGCDYFGIENCEKEFDRLSLRAKWLKTPHQAVGKSIPENSRAIEMLDELVRVRHRIIHYRIFDMRTEVIPACESTEELAKLTQKCARNSVPTVKALISELREIDKSPVFQKFATDFLIR